MFDEVRESLHNFRAKKDLIDIAHVKHVNNPTKIGTSALPPCVVAVNNQVMKDVDALTGAQFL